MNKLHWTSEYLHEYPVSNQQQQQQQQQQYISKVELEHQANMMYPVSPFYTTANTSPSASPNNNNVVHGKEAIMTMKQHSPGSPDSLMSGLSNSTTHIFHQVPPQLVQSTSTSTTSSSATAYLNETIAKASQLPESFYPEFLQYSKESFEQSNNRGNKKRNRDMQEKSQQQSSSSSEDDEEDDDDEKRPARKQKVDQKQEGDKASVSELRRQIHIQSEQKRRAQIKDGFEELRGELPTCLNKKMSKVTLLHRTVQHIQHLKSTQATILAELERLVQENEQLRNFQQSVLQKQALENMYSIGNM